ncbi:MAG: SDR family NAD(P)-dependent oxidoreductase, partial [Pseudomonadales bacterium]|nr:SDR family NAD(P)-dependent oxidoreductase [Pseudomonadales bacterium]
MGNAVKPQFSLDLSDQTALVTGTTSGLGRRFAQILAACGAKVALAGRRTERLDELANEIRESGGTVLPVMLDMTNRDAIRGSVQQIESELGLISILVNNAGIPDAQWAIKIDDDLLDRVFDTNLIGPYVLSCEVARRLIAAKKPGRMVNISSMAAFNTGPQSAASLYSTTKAGIARMTEALAVEWARYHINVNCIAPGAFASEMLDGMLERIGDISRT